MHVGTTVNILASLTGDTRNLFRISLITGLVERVNDSHPTRLITALSYLSPNCSQSILWFVELCYTQLFYARRCSLSNIFHTVFQLDSKRCHILNIPYSVYLASNSTCSQLVTEQCIIRISRVLPMISMTLILERLCRLCTVNWSCRSLNRP